MGKEGSRNTSAAYPAWLLFFPQNVIQADNEDFAHLSCILRHYGAWHAHKHEQNIQYFPESVRETVYTRHNVASQPKRSDEVLGLLELAFTYNLSSILTCDTRTWLQTHHLPHARWCTLFNSNASTLTAVKTARNTQFAWKRWWQGIFLSQRYV